MANKVGPRVRCRKCKDVIQSMYRHDFVSCSCKAIFVDGGGVYFRFGGEPENAEYEDGTPLFRDNETIQSVVETVKKDDDGGG